MDEFALIRNYFAPLARDYGGSLNLTDDAALIEAPAGTQMVVTKDAISEGIHFLGSEEPGLIAKKLLRVNLSDLAAMGATPIAYLLAVMLPRSINEDWVRHFAEGLRQDQEQFHIHLTGGDTISTHGPLSFSITAFGSVPTSKALRRSGAKDGDLIYVSGTLGDSALGLQLLQGNKELDSSLSKNEGLFLEQRYLLPEPRLALGQRLLPLAHAAMDISDGLVQDLGHICHASNVSATIHRHQLPLSAAAKKAIDHDAGLGDTVLSGGDDYELLFTIPADKKNSIATLSTELNLSLTEIGHITTGSGKVTLLDDNGAESTVSRQGYRHF